MKQKAWKRLQRLVLALVLVYIGAGVAIYLLQDSLLFHPQSLSRDYKYSFDQPFEEINLPFGKDNLNILRFPTAEERRGIALFFHGNVANVEHYKQYPFFFTRNGYEVWMIDYPGFGKTT